MTTNQDYRSQTPGEFLDSSKTKCFLECPRKFYWRHVRKLVPLHEKAALSFGKAIHEALYEWHKTYDLERTIEIFHEHWDDKIDEQLRTAEKGESLLKGYAERYPPKHEPFKFLSLEQKVQIEIGDFVYGGRIDGIVEWGGMYLVLDHKTASRMGPKYFDRFRPDLQMTGYAFMAKQLFKQHIHGVVINVLYFTKKQMDFVREISSREPFEYEQFASLILNLASQIKANDPEDMNSWLPNWTSCGDWGGCDYRDLCLSEDPEPLARSMYREEVWHPFIEDEDSQIIM